MAHRPKPTKKPLVFDQLEVREFLAKAIYDIKFPALKEEYQFVKDFELADPEGKG